MHPSIAGFVRLPKYVLVDRVRALVARSRPLPRPGWRQRFATSWAEGADPRWAATGPRAKDPFNHQQHGHGSEQQVGKPNGDKACRTPSTDHDARPAGEHGDEHPARAAAAHHLVHRKTERQHKEHESHNEHCDSAGMTRPDRGTLAPNGKNEDADAAIPHGQQRAPPALHHARRRRPIVNDHSSIVPRGAFPCKPPTATTRVAPADAYETAKQTTDVTRARSNGQGEMSSWVSAMMFVTTSERPGSTDGSPRSACPPRRGVPHGTAPRTRPR